MRGKQRESITLGHYPDISLQEARKKAMATLVTKPRTGPSQPLLDVLDEFICLHWDKLFSPKSTTQIIDFFDSIGHELT